MASKMGNGLVDVINRQAGHITPRDFVNRFYSSKDLLLRLSVYKNLESHRGCVNTVNFNTYGDLLITGSDDRMVKIWDWDGGTVKLGFDTSHTSNIFDAKFMPYSDDSRIVTCANDGEVRYAQILEDGSVHVKNIVTHREAAQKLALEPGNPHVFYSCGEDAFVYRIDLRTESGSPFFTCKSFRRSPWNKFNPLTTITIHPRNPNNIAVAGGDEFVRLIDIRQCVSHGSSVDRSSICDCFCPPHIIGNNQVSITGLAFSVHGELLASYCNESIYLFDLDNGLGSHPSTSLSSELRMEVPPLACKPEVNVFAGHRNILTTKGVSFFGSKCEYVVSGSDCGRIFIWRKKDGKLVRVMTGDKDVVNSVQSHPQSPILASCGIDHDIKIWIPNAAEASHSIPNDMNEVYYMTCLYDDEDSEEEDDDEDSNSDEGRGSNYDEDEDSNLDEDEGLELF